MNAEKILDALVGAKTQPGTERAAPERPRGFIEEALSAFGLGGEPRATEAGERPPARASGLGAIGQGFGDARGTLGDWTARAKEAMGRNPALTAGAIAAAAGLLLSGRGRGLLGSLAGVGGMGLIGALAYNAFQKHRERNASAPPPDTAALNPANATDEDARLFARVMVSAIAAVGRIDAVERARAAGALRQAGLEGDDAAWLEREFAAPAKAEDFAARSATPERAAQLYSAARLAIEPDTPEERAFLERLAAALKLDPALKTEIDGGASGMKAGA
jgi:uncharacterized membrane protein YebE (DUF533 family)